ncbi:hypothetical protein PPERSA_10960 [Pseudocohnilembus persalinus]|uniref:Uncharacterized protein n=1 Tax=Pseudocohnilembus persalinus TaxID=266149 RepID=A0A0V0QCE7_PSEPJ|nr:hypothetical protein PPERSA_10960 [Pseudocohnilembus persalinus]|eukprot:KRW99841.1 hypothetical protein PPERSA_10960 [Pseudocohnilembus persalinus]
MDLLKKLNPLYLKEQNAGNQQKQQNQQGQQGNLSSSGLATSQNMEVESKNPQHIDLLSQINMQNFQNQNQFPNFNQMENQMEKNIQQFEEENKDYIIQKQKGYDQDQDQQNVQNSEEKDEQKNKDQIVQENDQLDNEQIYQQQKNLQHNQQDMLKKQAQKEGKNVSFSVKNLTENFRVLYSQFYKDYSSVGEQYYNQSKNKYYSILGNLVLASLNQVQIFQVIYFDEEEGSKLRYLCEFDVEGEIQGIQVLPVAGSRIKNYLILQLQKDKLSVVLLDNNRDLMFKTVNMYNFDNKIVHQKVDIKGKSGKEKNILRIQQVQENFAPIMVATTAANRDILVILMTKQIQFPKNVEKYKDYRLKFNPDFFDSWAIQEEGKQDPTRLFGPSIYISLKKDFGVQNLVDFVFDQVGIIKTDLKSQRIFILDYRVIQEEKQDINTLLMQNQNMGEFQSTENVRVYNCCCLVKVNILTLFMKQQSQDSVLKNVSKFNSEDALGRVLSNLPSDCFKMLQIKYGGILIFSRFMIFLYQEEYQKLIVLPLIPLEELRKLSYDLSLLESSNINMMSFKKQFDNFEQNKALLMKSLQNLIQINIKNNLYFKKRDFLIGNNSVR